MTNLVSARTKALLVRPEFLKNTFYNLTDVYDLLGAKAAAPPLGLLIVAALLPKHWQLEFVDHDVTPLTEEHLDWADIVFVGGIGPQEETMLRVVRRAQAKGKLVVVGGSGPTLQPQVYAEADFVVSGEAEDTLPQLLADLEAGKRSGLYYSRERVPVSRMVVPRYDLAHLDQYMFVGVGLTRGCPFTCEFCAQIEIFGRTPRMKSPEQILAELQLIYDLGYRGMIDLGYDNLIGIPSKTKEVLRAMRDWAIRHDHPFCYSTEATINLANDPELLGLMRDNDFRYLFVGIESADDDVLANAQKGQNNTVTPAEAVKTFNAHGMIVNTGIILGFDGESDKSAQNILDMVQGTGAFPTLVLPLHALPSTTLSKRLAAEGRLFAEGELLMNTDERTDTATTGLNFVTSRPRVEIMRDLARVLTELYRPHKHYQRIDRTASWLVPAAKHKPSLRKLLQLSKSFARIATSIGVDKDVGPLFWKMLAKVAVTNPMAMEMAIGSAVMHYNYREQSKSYISALQEQIAYVEQMGESEYNQKMIARRRSAEPVRAAAQA